MPYARPGRIGDDAARRPRAARTSRRTGRPVRITASDADPAEAAASTDRIVLLRFEWRTSRDELQPVILALPELLD